MRRPLLLLLSLLFAVPLAAREGTLVQITGINSKHVQWARKVTVYLPPGYETSGVRYPVLYAHDGQNLFDRATASTGTTWNMDGNVEALMKAGLIKGLIVVGVWNTAARFDEYTPRGPLTKPGRKVDVASYGRFLAEELKPLVDARFRTLPGREHTGVIGSSLGGICSYYLLGLFPNTFSRAAAISPSFYWEESIAVADAAQLDFRRDARLYIDGGYRESADESGMIGLMRRVHGALLARGLRDFEQLWYYEDPVGIHTEADWARRGKMPILFMFGEPRRLASSLRLVMSPPELGAGDESNVYLEAATPDGMLATRYRGAVTSSNPRVAALDGLGLLRGLAGGRTTLSASFWGKTATRDLDVLPRSRDEVVLDLAVQVPEGTTALAARFESGGKKTELRFDKRDGRTFAVRWIGRVGQPVRIVFTDGQGRRAVRADGAAFEPRLALARSRALTLVIPAWK